VAKKPAKTAAAAAEAERDFWAAIDEMEASARAEQEAAEEAEFGAELEEMAEIAQRNPNAFMPEVVEGYYRASFHIRVYEGDREAGEYYINAWAQGLDRSTVREMTRFAKGETFKIEEANLRYADAFGWGATFWNWLSTGGVVTVTEFEPCEAHELGAFDIAGEALYARGVVQPTIGAPGGQFVLGGNPIARPEYYREDSCMLSLFME